MTRRRAWRSNTPSSTCSCCSPRWPSIGWWGETGVPLDPDDMRRRNVRNWAMLVVLLALSALFYAITIVKRMKS